jgi:DNA-binding MarR family transcriptional regulator
MSLELRDKLLKSVEASPCGVRELAKKIRRKTANVVSLIRAMEEEGLLRREELRKGRGRPMLIIKATSLGDDFLRTYSMLNLKMLRSRRADLVRAARDAEYAERLESRGLSTFALFLELNSIVGRDNLGVA